MATIDTNRTAYGSADAASRFFGFLGTTVASLIEWNDARVTRKALSGLTDRELEDIGLSRSDIDAVADNRITR